MKPIDPLYYYIDDICEIWAVTLGTINNWDNVCLLHIGDNSDNAAISWVCDGIDANHIIFMYVVLSY